MEAWRKRSLWNPMVLPHACGPKESCLRESRCHQEHLGNSLRCLYSISLLHISTAGSCVIISSHVLSWRGPFAKQKTDAEHLILTGTLRPTGRAGWSESTGWKHLSCRVWGWSAVGKAYGGKIWQLKLAASKMQMDLSGPRCHRAWQTLHSFVCDHLALHCRERNKLKAHRRCCLFK